MSMDADNHTTEQREAILKGILAQPLSDYARYKALPADERDALGFAKWQELQASDRWRQPEPPTEPATAGFFHGRTT